MNFSCQLYHQLQKLLKHETHQKTNFVTRLLPCLKFKGTVLWSHEVQCNFRFQGRYVTFNDVFSLPLVLCIENFCSWVEHFYMNWCGTQAAAWSPYVFTEMMSLVNAFMFLTEKRAISFPPQKHISGLY